MYRESYTNQARCEDDFDVTHESMYKRSSSADARRGHRKIETQLQIDREIVGNREKERTRE